MHSTILGVTHASALAYSDAGFSVIPLLLNGSKHAAVSWKEYQQHKPARQQLDSWFARDAAGIGIICGAVSGGLEVLDFDCPDTYVEFMRPASLLAAGLTQLISSTWRVMTPSGGAHLYYRHSGAQEGGTKLAMPANGKTSTGKTVLIETRAEGNYVVAPGSPRGVHKEGREGIVYIGINGAEGFKKLPVLTAEERQRVLDYARSFDRRTKAAPPVVVNRPVLRPVQPSTKERAGDAFNRQASWADVLVPHGWHLVRTDSKGQGFWKRPDGKPLSWGATSNGDGTDRLFVFTSSTVLPTNMPLDKFTVYAWLNFGGSHAEAAKQLARQGFGEFMRRRVA